MSITLLAICGTLASSDWTSFDLHSSFNSTTNAGGLVRRERKRVAVLSGSVAPMIPLTTATPSRALRDPFD